VLIARQHDGRPPNIGVITPTWQAPARLRRARLLDQTHGALDLDDPAHVLHTLEPTQHQP
jgi:hypothetical protein